MGISPVNSIYYGKMCRRIGAFEGSMRRIRAKKKGRSPYFYGKNLF